MDCAKRVGYHDTIHIVEVLMPSRSGLIALLSCATILCMSGCGSSGDRPASPQVPSGRRETRGRYTVVWLHGTPYQMGFQHGTLLHEEMQEATAMLQTNPLFKIMRGAAEDAGLESIALDNSYPEMVEECQGMVDAVANPDFGMFECLLVNFGDVAVEFLMDGIPEIEDIVPGCSQMVLSGSATADGRLYHGRILDWSKVDFVIQHPVVFVRSPDGGIPHAFIGFPGNLSSYQGINDAGLAIASNEVTPRDNSVHDRKGRSHVQMLVKMLTTAHSIEEARTIAQTANHMTLETVVVSDGNVGRGEVFEMAPAHVGIRHQQDGVVFATNHFLAPETESLDEDPCGDSTALRYQRLSQLLLPDGTESLYGTIDPEILVKKVMRDRVNPVTGVESPPTTFDDGQSLATNGALYEVVFDPQARRFWVAAGATPVPDQTFAGFSLDELLGKAGSSIPADIP